MTVALIKPVVTEKSSDRLSNNQYTFEVQAGLNKIEIKKHVEARFSVKVKNVNVLNRIGRKRRRGRIEGKSKDRRFAIVTLNEGDSIEEIKGLF